MNFVLGLFDGVRTDRRLSKGSSTPDAVRCVAVRRLAVCGNTTQYAARYRTASGVNEP